MTTRPPLQFELFQDRKKQWRWRLRSTYNGKIVCQSEGYKSKFGAEKTVSRIRAGATAAPVVEAKK